MQPEFPHFIHDFDAYTEAINNTVFYNNVRILLARREADKIPLVDAGNETFKYDAEKDGEVIEYEVSVASDDFYKSVIIRRATSDHWDDVRKRNPGTLDPDDPMYLSGWRIKKNKDGEDDWYIERSFLREIGSN